MERRIHEAAQTGNIELLQGAIRSDNLALKRAAISSSSTGDTALHIACLAANLPFVIEFLKHGKEFVYELNQDCWSPLHIAAMGGHIEIVRELLKVDVGLCLLKGREMRIPLHCAAVKGRADVLHELLVASPESIEFVTSRGETALHLAVTGRKFQALCVMLEHLEKLHVVDVINKRDERGDTILHVAAAKKQHEVIDLLLRGSSATSKGMIEVNCANEMGHTPLDLLRMAPSESGDIEIQDMFAKAGGLKAIELSRQPLQPVDNEHENSTLAPKRSYSSTFKFDNRRDKPDKVRDILLLIAVLITTSTFEAALSPPKISKNSPSEASDVGIRKLQIFEGFLEYAMAVFLAFNTLGFVLSLYMINILIRGFPLMRELQASIVGLAMTYAVSLIIRIPETSFYIVFLIAMALPLPMLAALKVYKFIARMREESANVEQMSQA